MNDSNRHKFLSSAWVKIGMATVLALGTGSAALAETFSIDGIALNTNSNFRLKDGHPIMSTWPLDVSDKDQQFMQETGNLSRHLRHRSTNKCLNANLPSPGSVVNVWPCDPTDGDQKFTLITVGGNRYLIKRVGTNLCLDMASRTSYQRILLQNCSSLNVNQLFYRS